MKRSMMPPPSTVAAASGHHSAGGPAVPSPTTISTLVALPLSRSDAGRGRGGKQRERRGGEVATESREGEGGVSRPRPETEEEIGRRRCARLVGSAAPPGGTEEMKGIAIELWYFLIVRVSRLLRPT
jgi:hypothetical protein